MIIFLLFLNKIFNFAKLNLTFINIQNFITCLLLLPLEPKKVLHL